MLKIWIPIILGIIIVPMIGTKIKEMEDKLTSGDIKYNKKVKNEEDYKRKIEMLTHSVIAILVVIAITLALIIRSGIMAD